MDLEDLEIYREAMDLGESVWGQVDGWAENAIKTVGIQLVRSCDSVAANIAEGFGRYHFKENKKFCYYARGSLRETKTWLEKAGARGFIPKGEAAVFTHRCDTLRYRLDAYIKSIGRVSRS